MFFCGFVINSQERSSKRRKACWRRHGYGRNVRLKTYIRIRLIFKFPLLNSERMFNKKFLRFTLKKVLKRNSFVI